MNSGRMPLECVFFKICVDRNGLIGFFCLIVAQCIRFYSGLIES